MTMTGLSIDMLNVGRADCFLATVHHDDGGHNLILIDGGYKQNADDVKKFLDAHMESTGMPHICDIVNTHPDADHVGGLIEIVKDTKYQISRVWAHDPSKHADVQDVKARLAKNASEKSKRVQKALADAEDLISAANARGIPVLEPFAGHSIGPFVVAGPTPEYYAELLASFKSLAQLEQATILAKASADEEDDALLEEPETSAENNSSAILRATIDGKRVLLTGDAGVQALDRARKAYDLTGLDLMQIPHHGSRRNINQRLIDHFSPRLAFVSADGSEKHPRQAVVDAFKKKGTRVYSTHHPSPSSKLMTWGSAPSRAGYSAAEPL